MNRPIICLGEFQHKYINQREMKRVIPHWLAILVWLTHILETIQNCTLTRIFLEMYENL